MCLSKATPKLCTLRNCPNFFNNENTTRLKKKNLSQSKKFRFPSHSVKKTKKDIQIELTVKKKRKEKKTKAEFDFQQRNYEHYAIARASSIKRTLPGLKKNNNLSQSKKVHFPSQSAKKTGKDTQIELTVKRKGREKKKRKMNLISNNENAQGIMCAN